MVENAGMRSICCVSRISLACLIDYSYDIFVANSECMELNLSDNL